MSTQIFKNIPSLQEVECSGRSLPAEVKLMSLTMSTSDKSSLVILNVITNSCLTQSEYSSCYVDGTNSHESLVRMLVSDLQEGESNEYLCEALALNSQGKAETTVWNIEVIRPSKYVIVVNI
jgi:hypothetical protein